MMNVENVFSLGINKYGWMKNKVQLDYANHVHDVIERSHASEHKHGQALVEAETGVGKTLGYLVPTLLNVIKRQERAIISTFTIALQHQITRPGGDMDRALDVVEAITGKRPSCAVRVGMHNFVDPKRFELIIEQARKEGLNEDDMNEWEKMYEWSLSTETGEIREYLEREDVDGMPPGLMQRDICINHSSSPEAKARYQAHVEAAKEADVLITNHSLLICNSRFGGRLLQNPDDDRQLGVLVVDECDRLEDAANSAFSQSLSLSELSHTIQKWNETNESSHGKDYIKKLNQFVISLANNYLAKEITTTETYLLVDEINQDGRDALKNTLSAMLTDIGKLVKIINQKDGIISIEDELILHSHQNLKTFIQIMSGDNDTNEIAALRWSPKRHNPSLQILCLNPARILKAMWDRNLTEKQLAGIKQAAKDKEIALDEMLRSVNKLRSISTIFTSATICVPTVDGKENFAEMEIKLGIYQKNNPCSDLNKSFFPKEFGRASFVFPDPSGPTVFIKDNLDELESENIELNPEWIAYASSMIAKAHKAGGRVLVLTSSFRSTRALSNALYSQGITVLEHEKRRMKSELFPSIVEDNNSIFISPSAWEGMDLSTYGPNIFSHIVITQLPYIRNNGAREHAVRRKLKRNGKSPKEINNIIHASIRLHALKRFKQGFGRGIRKSSDNMTLWVADPRFPVPDALVKNTSIPCRTVQSHKEFLYAIPYRFRTKKFVAGKFITDVETKGSVFLKNGTLLKHQE